MVALRFAPSPTGSLHLGGLRTALINSLVARKLNGKLILRIEDTDRTRFDPGSLANIQNGLGWAGIHFDYGPGIGGPHGSYFQSQRLDLYHSHSKKLLENRKAYRCFCSPDKLVQIKQELLSRGSRASYNRTCFHLTEEDVARRLRLGQAYTVRLNDNEAQTLSSARDEIFGTVRQSMSTRTTDTILIKSDGFPTYHFANVIDDHAMDITHVIRGEEWLPSLFLHLEIYSTLDFPPPTFAHLPILLNPDGSKMSKRNFSAHLSDYVEQGWEPEAVRKWLLSAGWKGLTQNASETSIDSVNDSITNFTLDSVSHRRSILDPSHLRFLNIRVLKDLKDDILKQKAFPLFRRRFPNSEYVTEEFVISVVKIMLSGRCSTLSAIPDSVPYLFEEPDYTTTEATTLRISIDSKVYDAAIQHCLEHLDLASDPTLKQTAATFDGPKGAFFKCVRYALTGVKTGPSLEELLTLLGRNRIEDRLKRSLVATR